MTQRPADNESFPSNSELFALQDKTFAWVVSHGILEPSVGLVGRRDGLDVADAGAAHSIALDADKLRNIAPQAVASLALEGLLGVSATHPYYDSYERQFWPRHVGYNVQHGPHSLYTSTDYSLSGHSAENIRQDILRWGPGDESMLTEEAEALLARAYEARRLESELGIDRLAKTEYTALSAIMDICIERGPQAFVHL
ncbi:MAG TPA: hypothetical protein VLF43_03705 [Candidatus Saccharimonadales bacterium]|nr:hypothetical protein [Candidatus Saccharimonadales bacterium]